MFFPPAPEHRADAGRYSPERRREARRSPAREPQLLWKHDRWIRDAVP